jgi:hypothetical protein
MTLPFAVFGARHRHAWPSCEALRIAVHQPRLRIPDVAFLDNSTAQCEVLLHARDPAINENESKGDRIFSCQNISDAHEESLRCSALDSVLDLDVRSQTKG